MYNGFQMFYSAMNMAISRKGLICKDFSSHTGGSSTDFTPQFSENRATNMQASAKTVKSEGNDRT